MIKTLKSIYKKYIIGCNHNHKFIKISKELKYNGVDVDFVYYREYKCSKCDDKKHELYAVNGFRYD